MARKKPTSEKAYTKTELYDLYVQFDEDDHALQILSDFMGTDKTSAAVLLAEFAARRSAQTLGLEERGKEGRYTGYV